MWLNSRVLLVDPMKLVIEVGKSCSGRRAADAPAGQVEKSVGDALDDTMAELGELRYKSAQRATAPTPSDARKKRRDDENILVDDKCRWPFELGSVAHATEEFQLQLDCTEAELANSIAMRSVRWDTSGAAASLNSAALEPAAPAAVRDLLRAVLDTRFDRFSSGDLLWQALGLDDQRTGFGVKR